VNNKHDKLIFHVLVNDIILAQNLCGRLSALCTANYTVHAKLEHTQITINCRELELNTGQQMTRSTIKLYSLYGEQPESNQHFIIYCE